MERFVKGDVVVLPFPYTDLLTFKRRPALVVAILKNMDVILAQITSKQRYDEGIIKLEQSDMHSGGLNEESFIVPSKLFTADSSLIEYKAGRLNQNKIKEVENKLCEIFTR